MYLNMKVAKDRHFPWTFILVYKIWQPIAASGNFSQKSLPDIAGLIPVPILFCATSPPSLVLTEIHEIKITENKPHRSTI